MLYLQQYHIYIINYSYISPQEILIPQKLIHFNIMKY